MADGSPGKCPLFIVVPVYQSFYDASRKGGVVELPGANDALFGYHAVLIRGWKKIDGKLYWVMVNSWGRDQGDNGVWYLPFGYPVTEAWMVTDDNPQPPVPQPKSFWQILIEFIINLFKK